MEHHDGVVALQPREGISIDPVQLQGLRKNGTGDEGEADPSEALEDLALGLSRLAMNYRSGRMQAVAQDSRRIAGIANGIGLDRLGRVAGTVAVLSGGTDCVALAANLGRLMRLGNTALTTIWDLQDQIV